MKKLLLHAGCKKFAIEWHSLGIQLHLAVSKKEFETATQKTVYLGKVKADRFRHQTSKLINTIQTILVEDWLVPTSKLPLPAMSG